MSALRYPIRAVAKLTGLSVDTLRAWEKRYHVVTPDRGQRGRLYSDDHVHRLRMLRDAVGLGHAIGQVAHVPDDHLRELLDRPASNGSNGHHFNGAGADPVVSALDRHDYGEANLLLSRLAALLPVRDIVDHAALALVDAGRAKWKASRWSEAQFRSAYSLAVQLLASTLRVINPTQAPVRIVVAALPGDREPAVLWGGAVVAAERGVGVIHLGEPAPARVVAEAASKAKASVILTRGDVADELAELASIAGDTVEVWKIGGGQAVPDNVVTLDDMNAVERHCRRLSGSRQ